MEAIGPGTAIG